MGRTETITCEYLKSMEVFADVLNIVLYLGRKVVKPENITELDTSYMSIIPDNIEGVELSDTDTFAKAARIGKKKKTHTNIRRYRYILRMVRFEDIHNNDEVKSCVRVIAGIEQQTNVHYAMPIRDMLYDALEYVEQIKKISATTKRNSKAVKNLITNAEFLSEIGKDDKLIPVVTIVVYFQTEEWDGPRSLHEMLDFTGMSEELVKIIPDYKMLILQPSCYDEIPDNELNSTLPIVMGLLKCAGSKTEFQNYINDHAERFRNLPKDAVEVINEYCSIGVPEERIKEEKVIAMCKAMEEIREEERSKGRIKGEQIGKVIAYMDMGVSLEEIAVKLNVTLGEVKQIIHQCPD